VQDDDEDDNDGSINSPMIKGILSTDDKPLKAPPNLPTIDTAPEFHDDGDRPLSLEELKAGLVG